MLNRSRRQSCACEVGVKCVITLGKRIFNESAFESVKKSFILSTWYAYSQISITLRAGSPNYPNKI